VVRVSLLAVVRSIALRHVSDASCAEIRLSLPLPGKKTVRMGVMLKKLSTTVEAS
jgi:hypothetical protein